ncbi:Tetratricopeptide repeat-containing protein, partial [Cladophialophora immunda]
MVEDLVTLGGVNVGEMDHEQAIELFYKTSQLTALSTEAGEKVRQIVEELGCLALAVSLAGAYVRETPRLRSNVGEYLVEYRQRRRDILQRKPTRLVDQYSESVLTTWETSFRAVQEQSSAAAQLLTMLAFLSDDDIYLDLFPLDRKAIGVTCRDPGHQDPHARTWRRRFFPAMQLDLYVVEESFRMLDRYSLVHWQEDQESYSMHRLVHAWGYDRLSPTAQKILSAGSVDFVDEAISRCGATPQDKLRLAPHIMTCFGWVTSIGIERAYWEEIGWRLQRMGSFMDELGRWSDVRLIKLFMLETVKSLYGQEHPDTISAMNNLANTLGDQGQLEAAA